MKDEVLLECLLQVSSKLGVYGDEWRDERST